MPDAVTMLRAARDRRLCRTRRDLQQEIDDRMARIPTRLNAYGYDAWGFHTETREARARDHHPALSLLVPRRDARHPEHPAGPLPAHLATTPGRSRSTPP